MKLQKATYCALYAVLELARDPDVQLSATDIADKYNISANHLAKVLRDLGRAGLVESVRGAGGGYRFAGNLKRTTLFDVIHLFEDVSENERARDSQADTDIGNALNLVLREIDEIAIATLGSITIGTLLKTMRWRTERVERDQENV
ncbi:MAG: Rrf2 family transcriptional regulator [Terasakiella sp.]|uniref:Rrf2 family transcriptional regulator n=1 Tax=unclassified Terasakiella TaxID=2614952 RepID=UPI003AFF9225